MKPVIGAILSLVFDYQIGVIPVPNMEATIAYTIHKIMERVDGKQQQPISYFRSPQGRSSDLEVNVTLDMLCNIPGIGPSIGIEVLKAYPSIEKLTQASIPELANLPKIGQAKATTIYNALRGKI
ncbi:MAG: helix-hairpin-helix domain-containing protein [Candidatus Thorarchaeota archaeon]